MMLLSPSEGDDLMGTDCELAKISQVRAFWAEDRLIVSATGDVPETCWEVTIQKSLITVWPPEFAVERCRNEMVCLRVVTPYSASAEFEMGTQPNSIVVHHSGGSANVDVEQIPTVELFPSSHADEGGDFDEAVGMSGSMSFDEAFADGIRHLPRWEPSNPDEMSSVEVTGIGGWFGGFAGFRHLVIRVRRRKSMAPD
jgi:hypothetical protein